MLSDDDDERLQFWKKCKDGSFLLHEEIDKQIKSDKPPTQETLKIWMSELRLFNKNITRYSRLVTMYETRIRLEVELLKQSMTHDILDREATFTNTLETIRNMEQSSLNTNVEIPEGSVLRSLNVVTSINAAMGAMTTSTEPSYGDAEKCQNLLNGD